MSDAAQRALASIEKEIGKEFVAVQKVQRAPLSLVRLNAGIGGGLPFGRLTLVYGPSDAGKTTLALHMIADTLRAEPSPKKGGRRAIYLDHECALDLEYARRIVGRCAFCPTIADIRKQWSKHRFLIVPPPTFETGARLADALVSTGDVAIMVHDSIASMVPEEESDDGAENRGYPVLPRQLARWLQKHKQRCSTHSTIGVFLNHAKPKLGGFGWSQPGGEAPRFYSDVWLFVTGSAIKARPAGRCMRIRVKRNKTSRDRGGLFEYEITGEDGIDIDAELVHLALEHGLVTKPERATKYRIGKRMLTKEEVADEARSGCLRVPLADAMQPSE